MLVKNFYDNFNDSALTPGAGVANLVCVVVLAAPI
jgi:hypothetical protein